MCGFQGYGCMSLTDFYGGKIAEGAEATLKHVLDEGVTVLNTANFYGPYVNEEVIGESDRMSLSSLIAPATCFWCSNPVGTLALADDFWARMRGS
jgi:diketogulonate reductase-like aldo/keto reductase